MSTPKPRGVAAMGLRDRVNRHAASGKQIYQMRQELLSIGDDYWIENESGEKAFKVDVDGGAEMTAHGNLVDHEYEIERSGDTVATVSKKWFRVRERYCGEIEPGEDDVLILAITVCIDALTRD